MQRKKMFLFFAVMVAGIAFGGWWLIFPADATDMKGSEKTYPVQVASVEKSDFSPYGVYGGFVKSVNQAVVAPKINGRIVRIDKQEGDFVKKGEVVAVLSADELISQVQGANEMLSSLGETLKGTKKYYEQKVDEAKDGDAGEEAVKSAKRLKDLQKQSVQNSIDEARGSLRVAQSLAKETLVRAPFEGVIVHMFAEVGQLAGPTTTLFEIADQSQLEIELWIPEELGEYMKIGDTVNIFAKENDGEKMNMAGKIKSIGLGARSGAQKIHLQIQLPVSPSVRLGQYMNIELPMGEMKRQSIVVAQQAIVHKYDETFIWVVKDNHARQRKVFLGASHDGEVEVKEGIQEGEQIITAGMHMLKENNVVKIYE